VCAVGWGGLLGALFLVRPNKTKTKNDTDHYEHAME